MVAYVAYDFKRIIANVAYVLLNSFLAGLASAISIEGRYRSID